MFIVYMGRLGLSNYKIDQTKTMDDYRPKRGNLLGLLLWTVILSVIVTIILVFWKPDITQKTNIDGDPIGEMDGAKTILAAAIVSLTIVLLVYLISTASFRRKKETNSEIEGHS